MKQKAVIEVCMNGNKSRSKALKIAVGLTGVESAAIKGEEKNQIEVTGNGMDVVALTKLLRKKVGFAELASVNPVEEKKKEEYDQILPWFPNPHYYAYEVRDVYDQPPCCSIM